MAMSEDSRPFIFLQQSSEDFQTEFNKNIQRCLKELNSKITALLCDPDSVSSSFGDSKKRTAHMEFSKAKYDIFVSMQTLLEEFESEWFQQLGDMKKNFLENVEIFLAETKLEVKLPPSQTLPRNGRQSTASARRQESLSSPKVSSLYPVLMNTAKHIPVLSNLLPDSDDEEFDDLINEASGSMNFITPPKPKGKTPKKVTIVTAPTFEAPPANIEDEEEEEESEGEEEPVVVTPIKKPPGRSRKSAAYTPVSVRKGRAIYTEDNVSANVEDEEESEDDEKPVVFTPNKQPPGRSRRSAAFTQVSVRKGKDVSNVQYNEVVEEEEVKTPARKGGRGRKSAVSAPVRNERTKTPIREWAANKVAKEVSVANTVNSRRTAVAKRFQNQSAVVQDMDMESSDSEESEIYPPPAKAIVNTPKQMQYSVGLDPMEDLEVYSPVIEVPKSASRRKTMVAQAMDSFPDINLTPGVVRNNSKRKTIAFNADDLPVAPSPKRLKRAVGRNSLAPSALTVVQHPRDLNPLDSEGVSGGSQYSPWIPLSDVDGKVPAQPGVYELKVLQAKKPAYIGSCDSLRQKLTLHRLVHSSGHKHLDKFIERNTSQNVLVRFEPLSSNLDAESEKKTRVKAFVAQYKTTPSYN